MGIDRAKEYIGDSQSGNPAVSFRVVEFMKDRTEWGRTATELIADMEETETTPNVVTKYLGQFSCEVLETAGIEYRTNGWEKQAGQVHTT